MRSQIADEHPGVSVVAPSLKVHTRHGQQRLHCASTDMKRRRICNPPASRGRGRNVTTAESVSLIHWTPAKPSKCPIVGGAVSQRLLSQCLVNGLTGQVPADFPKVSMGGYWNSRLETAADRGRITGNPEVIRDPDRIGPDIRDYRNLAHHRQTCYCIRPS